MCCFCTLWAKGRFSTAGCHTVVSLRRLLASLGRLCCFSAQENYSKVGMISQEEFQAQREALSTRPPEGEDAEADDMLFQMDEQPPLANPQAKAVEGSVVSEGSDSVSEETSQKKSPPSSPLRFYPLPDKSEAPAAKDKVRIGGSDGHWRVPSSLVPCLRRCVVHLCRGCFCVLCL